MNELNKKHTLQDMQDEAAKRGGICLSTEYVNNKTKLEFKCSNNHIFTLRPVGMLVENYWCKKCADSNKRYDISFIKQLAEKRKANCYLKII